MVCLTANSATAIKPSATSAAGSLNRFTVRSLAVLNVVSGGAESVRPRLNAGRPRPPRS